MSDPALPPPTVALFLKFPLPGRVKTRLAASLGPELAAGAFRALAEHQLAAVPVPWNIIVCHDPPDAAAAFRAWLGPRPALAPQCPGDLGARLRHALHHHFPRHQAPLIFLGGDCPWLDDSALRQLASTLATHDAALIPATDGGYCALGLSGPHDALLEDIPWSTSDVLSVTLHRAVSAHLTVATLPMLEDVDEEPAWRRAISAFPALAANAARGPMPAPPAPVPT